MGYTIFADGCLQVAVDSGCLCFGVSDSSGRASASGEFTALVYLFYVGFGGRCSLKMGIGNFLAELNDRCTACSVCVFNVGLLCCVNVCNYCEICCVGRV